MVPCELEIHCPASAIRRVTVIVDGSIKREQLKEGEYLPPNVGEVESNKELTRVTFDQPLHAVTLSPVGGKPSEDPIIRVEGSCQVVTVNNSDFVSNCVNFQRGDFVSIHHLPDVKDAKNT